MPPCLLRGEVQDINRTAGKNAVRMLGMAMDMLEALSCVLEPKSGQPIQMRIGIHTGSIVAGEPLLPQGAVVACLLGGPPVCALPVDPLLRCVNAAVL